MSAARTTFVIATRDRSEELRGNLLRLLDAHDIPVIVVDNGSTDDTREMVDALRTDHPGGSRLRLVALPRNLGAVARNVGVEHADTEFVAFCDDDSWWQAGATEVAARHFDAHARLAVIAATTLVGPTRRRDTFSDLLAASPLPTPAGFPGPTILGFMSCAVVVRAAAFLEVGGFSDVLFFRGEEQLVALDLTTAGWQLCYCPELVTHHEPSPHRATPAAQHARVLRNDFLTSAMRRPTDRCVATAATLLRAATTDVAYVRATGEALLRLPAALRRRRRLPADLERQVRLLEAQPD